ncbi:MAG: hypothetical protein M3237_03300 [Actinomycetota bacterium]|nr:hypothetical protein [Actinomycetota bacterium]
MRPLFVPLHLGSLHPAETALTLVLAFGPFLLLGVVIVVRRRQDRREEEQGQRDK